MSNEITTVWTKQASKRGIEPLLLGRQISNEWLESSIRTTSVRFSGDLLGALMDLRDAAKTSKKNLPITSLRLMLQASMDGVLNVDKDLGCDPRYQTSAIELHESQSGDAVLCSKIAEQVKMWCRETLEVWAEKEQFGELAIRVKRAAVPENIALATSQQFLRDPQSKKPNFNLINRLIAEQLAGEVLFDGMGLCEVVSPQEPSPRKIDLMSPPKKPISEMGGKNAFSMGASIHISTVPYSDNVYFSISCFKRVWAEKMPDGGNTGSSATAYVLAPGRPVIPVEVRRCKIDETWQWDFANEYASLNIEARGKLPANLKAAFGHGAYAAGQWWVGLPQVTRLYRRVDQHTAMESDEVELLKVVLPMLAGIVDCEIPMTTRRLALNKKPESAMLRLGDVGAAGVSIADADEDEAEDELDENEDEITESGDRAAIGKFRDQCVQVLKAAFDNRKAALWIIGGSQQEQDLASKTAELIFGEAVKVTTDPLPVNVHGLKADLPGATLKSKLRFSERVAAWTCSGLPQAIALHDGPKFVLICASREISGKMEDSVNRRAAIHAICSMADASVHHVLPIEPTKFPSKVLKVTQAFMHRVQSAMMDVMLAHSGYVLGAKDFVKDQLSDDRLPKGIYGIQALRRHSQQYTGEIPVCMLIYSKLNLNTNVTEVNFIYRSANRTQTSGWMPLSRGLIWLGKQRNIEGDENWLKAEFQTSTINVLGEVQKEDPSAVVLIDWGTVSGLWTDLTDVSLGQRAPHIGHLELSSSFPKMSFARLRYGRDAKIALRSWSKTSYEGFREEDSRRATGELFEDGYAVTVKQLVEVNPDSTHTNRGHFIGVMGARKTFQLKRGMSCYRLMVRMSPVMEKETRKKEKGVFSKLTLSPSDKDATIPSAMDITVLQCPAGVSPLDIATLAMGLRVGYAHYDDWTILPAPLFFVRKIDDYIVKYPHTEEEGESVIESVMAVPAEVEDAVNTEESVESTKMRMVRDLVQRELNLEFKEQDSGQTEILSVPSVLDESIPLQHAETEGTQVLHRRDINADVLDETPESLLVRAKNADPIHMYPAPDQKRRRVYSAMVRGQIRVQVEVPYFVNLVGFFGSYKPEMKNRIQKSWKEIQVFGQVSPKKPRPDLHLYLDWLADKLKHPQGAFMTSALKLFERVLIIPIAHEIFLKYNETAVEKIPVCIREGGKLCMDFSMIVRKACEENDDYTLAWLVFTAAQTPAFGLADSIVNSIDRIPGDMTTAALLYYIQCADAIRTALANFVDIGGFKDIYLKRPMSGPKERFEVSDDVQNLIDDLVRGNVPVAEEIRQDTKENIVEIKKTSEEGGDRIMELKDKIKTVIDGFELGQDSFAKRLDEFKILFDQLLEIDKQLREDEVQKKVTALKFSELESLAKSILQRLSEIDDENALGIYRYEKPQWDKFDSAMAEVIAIEKSVTKAEIPDKQLRVLVATSLPSGSTKSEHKRRAIDVSGLSTAVSDELVQVKKQLEESIVFVNDAPTGGDSTDNSQSQLSKENTNGSTDVGEFEGVDRAFATESLNVGVEVVQEASKVTAVPLSPKDDLEVKDSVDAAPEVEPIHVQDAMVEEVLLNSVEQDIQEGHDAKVDDEEGHRTSTNVPEEINAPNPEPIRAELPTHMVDVAIEDSKAIVEPIKTMDVQTVPSMEVKDPPFKDESTRLIHKHDGIENPKEVVLEKTQETTSVGKRSEIVETELTHNEIALQRAYSRLKSLMDLRHYGLAEVYVDAIKTSFVDSQVSAQCDILGALVDALESIDCSFTVDSRLNQNLRILLNNNSITSTFRCTAHLGMFAAGFMSALFSSIQNDGGVQDDSLWTVVGPVRQPLTRYVAIASLIEHMVSRENKGIVLTREKFSASKIGSKMALEAELERCKKRAENWRRDPEIYSGFGHSGFLRMHEFIYGSKHPIGQCVALAAKGDIKGLKRAFDDATGKFRKPIATAVEAFKTIGEKNKPDGRYAVNTYSNIEITERFLSEFIERSEHGVAKKDVIQKHEQEYLQELHSCLRKAIDEIDEMPPESGMVEQIYVQSTKKIFESVLRLFDESSGNACVPVVQQKLLVQQPMDRLLNPSMHDIDDIGVKAVTEGEQVIETIDALLEDELLMHPSPLSQDVSDRLLADAQESHIDARRFLPAFVIEQQLPKGYTKHDPPLLQQYQKVKADLTRELQEARQRVTHAMALSALDQKDASSMLRIIDSIHTSNSTDRAIGHPEGNSSAYPDFPHALATLQNQVIKILDARLGDAKEKLLTDLREFEEAHGEDVSRDVERIRKMLSKNNPASIRTAHDACAILRNSGKLPAYVLNSGRNPPKEYETFLDSLSKIRGQHVLLDSLEAILRSDQNDGLPKEVSVLSGSQRSEAAQFIKFWKEICLNRGNDAVELAATFFAGLGIGRPIYMPERTGRQLPSKFEFPKKAFATLTSGDCFVPPALGSNARIVCGFIISGNNPENEISSLVQDISNPTFILSRTNLSLVKRAKLSGQAPVILIDDALISYMALHPEDRARRMMEIATLTFHTTPYSAEGTSVPREMFFGRQRELTSLRGVKNLAILYGGRRLGKSSLLAQIEREEKTVAGSTAIYIPMDKDYAGGDDHVLFAWKKLYSGLQGEGLIAVIPNQAETDWRKYQEWVEKQLTADSQKSRSCYLLFDEADNLMAHELDLAPSQIGFVRSLQQTSENINPKYHLRYVIAGLHNLARMTTESNSALGKAETIALEPFSSDDDILRGIELVTKPMAALGFFFEEDGEDLPLRILSICNFYPAFIQIYCRKLLDHMYNKRRRDAYAYIKTADLEAIEKDHDLLTELQQKFSLSLELDKRYKAIALILADYYYSEVEVGKNEGLTVSEIRMWCEVEVPNHFQNMSAGAYEGLADEMRKLNVLERNGTRYRLRNPSIAMLIGDRGRIELQLKSLASAPPEKSRNHGDRRIGLTFIGNAHHGDKPPIFPMPVAWVYSQMDVIDGGLTILGGNNLSGLSDVTSARTEWQLTQNNKFQALPLPASSLTMHLSKLRKLASESNKVERLLLVSTSAGWKVNEIAQFSTSASRAANNGIRLALAAVPERLYEICTAIEAGTLVIGREKKTEISVAAVPPWSVDAVSFFLHENSAVSQSVEACQAIITASCGFGKEIQRICAGNLTVDGAMELVEKAKSQLAPNLATFYDKIGMPASISPALLSEMESFLTYVDGEKRNSTEIDSCLSMFGLNQSHLMFLNWMGLLQEASDSKWFVPKLYRDLLG